MDHSSETGAKHYKLSQREKNASAAAKYTGKLFGVVDEIEMAKKSDSNNVVSSTSKKHMNKVLKQDQVLKQKGAQEDILEQESAQEDLLEQESAQDIRKQESADQEELLEHEDSDDSDGFIPPSDDAVSGF